MFRSSDRPYTDGVTFDEFQRIARESVGRDRPNKDVDDWVRGVFRQPTSPGAKCPNKRKRTEAQWVQKLEAVDWSSSSVSPRKKARIEAPKESPILRKIANVENTVMLVDGPRTPPSARMRPTRLGSVTNVTAASSSQPSVATEAESHPQVVMSSSMGRLHISQPSSSLPKSENVPPLLAESHQAPGFTYLAVATPAPSGPPLDSSPWAKPPRTDKISVASNISSNARTFLETSIVWLARPNGSDRPSWRAASHAVIPLGNQVHTLDAVFVGCGWTSHPACDWAKRGSVFVDDQEGDLKDSWAKYALKALAERRKALQASGSESGCKPVLVFSAKMLSRDVLLGLKDEADWESRVLCRF